MDIESRSEIDSKATRDKSALWEGGRWWAWSRAKEVSPRQNPSCRCAAMAEVFPLKVCRNMSTKFLARTNTLSEDPQGSRTPRKTSEISRGKNCVPWVFDGKLFSHKLSVPPFVPGIVPGTNRVCPRDKPGEIGLPLCKIRRKPGFVPGFHRICPRDKPGEIPGTNPGSSQDQPDKKVYVYVPFSCLREDV